MTWRTEATGGAAAAQQEKPSGGDSPGPRAVSAALSSECLWTTAAGFIRFALMSVSAMIYVIFRLLLMAQEAVEGAGEGAGEGSGSCYD